MITWVVVSALAVIALSAVPCFFRRGTWATWQSLVGCGTLLTAALLVLADATPASPLEAEWGLPIGRFAVAIDAISAVFLALIALVGGVASAYGHRYWSPAQHPADAHRLRAFLGVCIAALGLVVIAADGILFLLAWEIMALTCFFLVTTEDKSASVRAAGWLYLVATHLATLMLIALFAVIYSETSSFAIAPLPDTLSSGARSAIFFLLLGAFGLKAGLMPLHVWLPSAHASAPSHVSALMSGVMIKMGIYGLVRFLGHVPNPPEVWAWLLLVLGVVSALAGVLFALGQHDLKRLLAYHSIENIGIIVIGLGLAMLGRSHGQPLWLALGLAGALLHVWNHGAFKALLFLAAGSVHHATGTRAIDRLGGLARRMPWTAALFLLGAVAICGLPPLNGFVSELLVYLGLLEAGTVSPTTIPAASLVIPALALVGALAVACFVKVAGAAFLGEPRSAEAAAAHESHPSMLVPMGVLALVCVLIGVLPILFVPLFDHAVAAWPLAPASPALADAVPLWPVSALALALALALGGAFWLSLRKVAASRTALEPTWDCAYARPRASMQYTASSFADPLVRLFGWVLRPTRHRPYIVGAMPAKSAYHSHVPEPVLERVVLPALQGGQRLLLRLRFVQQGRIQTYVLYLFLALFVLFLWMFFPLEHLFADFGAEGAFP